MENEILIINFKDLEDLSLSIKKFTDEISIIVSDKTESIIKKLLDREMEQGAWIYSTIEKVSPSPYNSFTCMGVLIHYTTRDKLQDYFNAQTLQE